MKSELQIPTNASEEELRKYLLRRDMARWKEEELLRFYQPQSYQLAFHNSTAHRRLSHGGVRGGKTLTNIVDIIWRCIGTDYGTEWANWHPDWIGDIKTPQWWRMTGPGMQEVVLKVLVQWCRKLIPRFALEGGEFNYNGKDHMLRFGNNSFIEFMSFDQEEGRAAGRPLHGVSWHESHKCGDYFRKQCINRLADFHGHAFADCCPEDGITWEFEWFEKAKGGDIDYDAIQFPTVENMYMYPDHDITKESPAIEQLKKDYNYDEQMLRVVLYGDFIAIGGLVYETLAAEKHRLTAKDAGVQPDWPIFVIVDPGIQKPHALNWACAGPGGQLHVLSEAEVGRGQVTQTMQELAWAIREKSKTQALAGVIFDPRWDWDNKTAKTSTGEPLNLQTELRKSLDAVGYTDVPLIPGRKDPSKWLGIDQVKKRLNVDASIQRPLLTINPDCPETWRQMKKYSCIPQKKTNPDSHRPRIRNVDDDHCDNIRNLLTAEGIEYSATIGRAVFTSEVVVDDYGLGF